MIETSSASVKGRIQSKSRDVLQKQLTEPTAAFGLQDQNQDSCRSEQRPGAADGRHDQQVHSLHAITAANILNKRLIEEFSWCFCTSHEHVTAGLSVI